MVLMLYRISVVVVMDLERLPRKKKNRSSRGMIQTSRGWLSMNSLEWETDSLDLHNSSNGVKRYSSSSPLVEAAAAATESSNQEQCGSVLFATRGGGSFSGFPRSDFFD